MKNNLPAKRKREIGERLREVRKSLGIEQWEMARKAGMSQAIISQYETGLTELSLFFLDFLKTKHGVSIDWMVFGTGKMDAKKVKAKKVKAKKKK